MTGTRGGPDETAADAEAFGLVLEAPVVTEFEVWPENVETLHVFLRASTLWRVDGMTGMTRGFDYPALETLMRMCEIKAPARVFEDLQLMELAALGVLNAKPAAAALT